MIRRSTLRWLVVLAVALVPFTFLGCGDDEPTAPAGDGNVVGPAGGVVSLAGGAVVLAFPENAVASEVELSATPTTGPSSDLVVPGTVFDLGPDGASFAVPVTLTLSYDPARLPSGVGEAELGIWRVSGSAWVPVAGSAVNTASNTVTAVLDGFSVYGVAAPPVDAVVVSPADVSVELGASVQLEASVRAEDGTPLPERPVTWSSAAEAVATVSGSGEVTGVSEGSTTVTATAGGVEGSASVTVTVPVAEVEVVPGSAELEAGETVQLTATPRDGAGNALDREVSWASDDESVATVDDSGEVTGVAEGTATVSATSEGVSGDATITVTPPAVASVEVTADVAGIVVGGTTQLDLTVRDAGDNVLEGRSATWSSSNEAVATIDAGGLVTTLGTGVVTLTATVDGVEGSVELTVTIDWHDFAGAWSGDWTNTTFGSTGAIEATVTIDVAGLSATILLDVDGQVFGIEDPLPMTITGTLGPTELHVDYDAPLHGQVLFDLSPGPFELESISVPAEGFEGWTYSGTNTTTTHTGAFTVEFTGGSTAEGEVEVTRQ